VALLPTRAAWSAYLLWHVRGQARAAFRPWAAVERDQVCRVRHMVTYAARHVPHYREALGRLGLTAGDVRTAVDLARFPLVGREDLQRDPERFMSAAVPRRRLVELRSGGSTGAPRSVYHDHAALFRNAAHSERDRSIRSRLLGRRTGYRQTLIASNFSGIRKVQAFLDDRGLFPHRTRVERQYLSLADPPADNLARINAFRPDVLHTYGSYLGCLFAFAHETGAPFHRPRVITYGGDGLSPAARLLIERQFGIPVFSIYQSIEALRIGFECEAHQGLHLNVDLYPVRIVDPEGRTLSPGASGEVVVSNLVNHGMVLLNYRLGDVAAQLPGPCSCGRSLPLLAPPPGRTDDLIALPSGTVIHPQAIRDLFNDEREIWQYQVIQEAPGRFRIDLVTPRAVDRPATQARVSGKFAARFGTCVTANVRFVDDVSRTAQGKVRAVLSTVGRRGGEANR
jgi:phenylacetate-CoA ligase